MLRSISAIGTAAGMTATDPGVTGSSAKNTSSRFFPHLKSAIGSSRRRPMTASTASADGRRSGRSLELPGASCPSVTVRFYDWNEGWSMGCSSRDDCWHIRPEDLEFAPAAFKVGDRVRAKASYRGFSITDRRPDVGTVVKSHDWSADVQFDDWKGGWADGWGDR